MNNHEKFLACQAAARQIVERYRAEAPEGCDPQNTWVAAVGVAVSVGTAAYSANQQKKNASKAAGASSKAQSEAQKAAGDGGVGLKMPAYIPNDIASLQKSAVKQDGVAYALSDNDFKKRHGGMVEAEKLAEARILKDQQGEHEFMPQMQAEMMTAGLAGAMDSFGTTPMNLTPGGAAEADVARNLGLGVMAFQDRNRTNRNNSLMMGEQIFQRRQFGLNGQDVTGISMTNNAGQNNANQAEFAMKMQQAQQQYRQAMDQNTANQQGIMAQQQAADQRSAAMAKMVGDGVNAAAGAYSGYRGQQSVGSYGGGGGVQGAAATSTTAGYNPNGNQSWRSSAAGANPTLQARI